jgi:hypothetical protein
MRKHFTLLVIIVAILTVLLAYSTLGLVKMKKNYIQTENIIIKQADMIYILTDFIKVSCKLNKTKLINCQLFDENNLSMSKTLFSCSQ